MKEIHNIEGTLKNVEVFARRSDGSALVSRLTIDSGSYENTVPYFGGLTDSSNSGDWRLPNRRELESLLDFENAFPALPNGHPFNNVQSSDYYWTSTSGVGGIVAWYVLMYGGSVGYDDKGFLHYVWCVRDPLQITGGQHKND